jgi:hypothetical protein
LTSITPPDPSRIVEVTWLIAAIRISGFGEPRPAMLWCSASHRR